MIVYRSPQQTGEHEAAAVSAIKRITVFVSVISNPVATSESLPARRSSAATITTSQETRHASSSNAL